MATSDIDQKILARVSKATSLSDPLLSSCLYQILGLSVLLSRKLYRARKLRRLDLSRDTKSLSLYYHIIWLSREGLTIAEIYVIPRTQKGQHGYECQVLSAKLRASFYHVFCLFHNNPPTSQYGNITNTSSTANNISLNAEGQFPAAAQPFESHNGQITGTSQADKKGKGAALRDPIPSMTSETSYVTNPYAVGGPAQSPPIPGLPPLAPHFLTRLPPGLAPLPLNIPGAARDLQPTCFLLPSLNYVPITQSHFATSTTMANDVLPGSHPLRLSVALEFAAFLWDCARDERGCRRVAREAIRGVYADDRPLADAEFDEAAGLVGGLGRWLRRRSSRERIKAEGKRRSGDSEKRLSGDALESLKHQEAMVRRTGATPGVDEGGMVRDRGRDVSGGGSGKKQGSKPKADSPPRKAKRAGDEAVKPELAGVAGGRRRSSASSQGSGPKQTGSSEKSGVKKEGRNKDKARTVSGNVQRNQETKIGAGGNDGRKTMPGTYF